MSLDAVYADGIEQGLQRWAANPGPEPEPGFSITSFLGSGATGLPAAALESGGSVADVLSAFGTAAAASGGSAGGMFSLPTPAEQKQEAEARDRMLKGDAFDTSAGNAMRRKAQEFAPDPLTTHTADQVMHGLVRFGAKALTDVGLMGPAGAVLLGLDEANTTTQNMRVEGVDTETAAKVGAVTGVISAAGAVLPIGGKTIAQTIGLVGVGGPGGFMTQEHLSRRILENAGYLDQASLHNPFDPLGLALSTVIPGGFGALHMRGEFRRAEGVKGGTLPLQQLRPEELRALKYDDPRLDQFASATAEKYGVPPALLLAVKNAGEKSGPTAVSGKGATGVMQFMEGTAKEMGLADRTDPLASIDAGARYLRKLHDAYGSWDAAVAHYNGGGAQAAIVRGGGVPTAKETLGYLNRVRDYVSQHTAQEAAQHPEAVDAARVAVLNDTVQRSLPDTPDAMAQVQRAADIVGESGGRAAEQEIAPVPRFQFQEESTGSHDGQTDVTITAMLGDQPAGRIDYTVYEGRPQISMVDVPEAMRRQGIGTELVQELQRRFPGQEIDWGMMTDDGAALRRSLRTVEQDVPEVRAKVAELERAVAERTALEQQAAKFDAIQHPTDEQAAAHREFVGQVGDRWNALHDRIDQLQSELRGASPTRTLIDTGEPPARSPVRSADNALPPHDSVTLAGDEPAKRPTEGFQLTEAKPAQAQPDAKAAERQLVELRKRESVLQSLLECLEVA